MTVLFSTFGRYMFKRFLMTILAVFALVFVLIYVLDVVELARITSSIPTATLLMVIEMSLLRTPPVAEQVFPFAALFGALIAFLSLSRKLELVVARAAGMSVWQFILPPLAVAVLLGVASVTVYNPMSAYLKSVAETSEARLFQRGQSSKGNEIWLRQKSVDGDAILRAEKAEIDTGTFRGVTAFEFDKVGRFVQRIAADSAILHDGFWQMINAHVTTPGVEPEFHDSFDLPTNLTRKQITQSLTPPETISFFSLLDWARSTKAAGLDATRYFQQFQSQLARPLLFAGMILVAASVTLRFSRTGGGGRAILGGVLSGFALYVISKLSSDLGAAGVISTVLAAFTPPVIACLLGTLSLLYQEDG